MIVNKNTPENPGYFRKDASSSISRERSAQMLTVSTSLVLIHGISLHESTKRWDVDSSSHLDYTTRDWGGVGVCEFLVLADVVLSENLC